MTKSRRRVVSEDPFNAETAPAGLRRERTPGPDLFVRNHGAVPSVSKEWRLRVRGKGGADVAFDLASLRLMPSRRVTMVLECAGNGRSGMRPTPAGVAWGEDAVGCVEFRGVSLSRLLRKARLGPTAGEVVFSGGDEDPNGVRFERSLPTAKAMDKDTLVAYEMNGEPISPEHGGPVRLVVPGWFGVASVKWLQAIQPMRRSFQGPYQKDHYWYRFQHHRQKDRPVREVLVKSNIVAPAPGELLSPGKQVRLWGWAWSAGPVQRVDVSVDGGESWSRAKLGPKTSPYAWREWSLTWTPGSIGRYELLVRATDAQGREQPMEPPWNKQGYGNHAVARRALVVQSSEARRGAKQTAATPQESERDWALQPSLADA